MAMTSSGETCYEIAGRGRSLVLVHGLGMTRAMWAPLMPALKERFRVVTYDLAGHGESPPPADPITLKSFSEQLHRLVAELAIAPVPVVGFSIGGMIVRRYVLDHPREVAAVAILNSPHGRTPAEQEAILKRVAQAREEGPGATIDAAIERWFTPAFREARPDAIAAIRAAILRNDRAIYHKLYRVLAEGEPELTAEIGAVRAPTLIMTCTDDPGNHPAMSEGMARLIPGAELEILAGLRHMGVWEAPGKYTDAILDFLARRLGKS